jgi:hypothetical protein
MPAKSLRFVLVCSIAAVGLVAALVAGEARKLAAPTRWLQHDITRPKPPVVLPAAPTPPTPAPRDAIVLFDGTNLDQWEGSEGGAAGWKVADGVMEVAPGTGAIQTKAKFGDVQLHVEWASPNPPVGTGQDRGNSGIFLMGMFEVQVIDSYRADTYADGQAGGLYGQYPPLANASRPPGEWQTYDIAFRRPRFGNDGSLIEPARFTVIHNGILIQNNEELWGGTNWLEPAPYDPHLDRGPIELQDHGHKVRFRNIWLRELAERPAPPSDYLADRKGVSLAAEALDALTGSYAMGHKKNSRPVVITREDDHLLFKMASRPRAIVMQPVSATEFVLPHADARFTFERDAAGKVTGIRLRVGDGEQVLEKLAP